MRTKTKFDGSEGSFISLVEAKAKTRRHRAKMSPKDLKAFFFGKDKLKEILNQKDCVGLRVYYGANADQTPELVIVGVTEDMNDISTKILDRAFPCPPYCHKEENNKGLG